MPRFLASPAKSRGLQIGLVLASDLRQRLSSPANAVIAATFLDQDGEPVVKARLSSRGPAYYTVRRRIQHAGLANAEHGPG